MVLSRCGWFDLITSSSSSVGGTYPHDFLHLQDMYEPKMKHWGKKAPGIVAKMMTTLEPALMKASFGLRLKARGAKRKYWKCILKAKFQQNKAARETLLKTAPHTLVEQARFPRESKYWDVSISKDGQSLIGQNVMGRMVQYVRDFGLKND